MAHDVSTLEREQIRRQTLRNWLLSSPALALLVVAAAGPLFIVVVYSFLTAGSYGGVVWELSYEGWFRVIFSRDIFDDTVSISTAHITIFWRSVQLSIDHIYMSDCRLSNCLLYCDASEANQKYMAFSDNNPVLDKFAYSYICYS